MSSIMSTAMQCELIETKRLISKLRDEGYGAQLDWATGHVRRTAPGCGVVDAFPHLELEVVMNGGADAISFFNWPDSRIPRDERCLNADFLPGLYDYLMEGLR